MIALRAAIDLARLPEEERPAGVESQARGGEGTGCPAGSSASEAAEADTILAG